MTVRLILLLILALVSVGTSQLPTIDCFTSTAALVDQPSCQWAVGNITDGTATLDQFELACNDSLACNSIYRSYVRNCFSNVLFGDIVQLVCAMTTTNDTCARVLLEDVTYEYILQVHLPQVGESCSNDYLSGGSCSLECMEVLRDVYERFGCCWIEILAYFPTIMTVGSEDAYDTLIGFFNWCGISPSFCDNRPLPQQSVCDNTITGLYNGSNCSEAISEFISSDFEERISDVATIQGCSSILFELGEICGEISPTVPVFGNIFSSLSKARNSNGLSCAQYASEMLEAYYFFTDQNMCIYDYARGMCSDDCRQTLRNIANLFGCCFSELLRSVALSIDDLQIQINYALLTSELQTFCGEPPLGFCEQSAVEYSDAAMNCINAANQVYGSDDLCTEGFVKIIEATSVPSVSAAAQDICLIQDCKNRLASFIYFLDACDGLDDNDIINQDFEYLTGLAKSTTCRTNGTTSCLAVLQQSPAALTVASAFSAPNEGTGICLSIFDDDNPRCSSECHDLLQAGAREMGCCFSEFGIAFFGEEGYNFLLAQCQLIGQRCDEIEVNNNDPCVMARIALRRDTDCNDAFATIVDTTMDVISRTTLNQTNMYLNTLCSNQGCTNATSAYFNACQSLISTDVTLDMIRSNYNGFACLQSDVNQIDCYALRLSEPTVAAALFAFGRTGSCESVLQSDGICSTICRSTINRALNYTGCCLTDIIQNSLRSNQMTTVTVEDVYTKCQIRGPSSCNMNISQASGQIQVKGFNMLLILLLWSCLDS